MIKRRLSRLLLIWDILTLVLVFVVVVLFFDNVVEPILVERGFEDVEDRIGRTEQQLTRGLLFLSRRPTLISSENQSVVMETVTRFALSEAEYPQSVSYLAARDEAGDVLCYGGTRRTAEVGMVDCAAVPLEPSLLELLGEEAAGTRRIDFSRDGDPYVGMAAFLSTPVDDASGSDYFVVLADSRSDFYATANRLRLALLVVVGGVLGAILFVKLLSTFAATREIRAIQAAIDEKSRLVREQGAIDAPVPLLPLAFRETEELYSSFEEMNGKLADLGSLVSGISDQDLFVATLKQDHSLLDPHQEEMAILFLDVKGFTTIAEERNEQAMVIINSIWSEVEDAVYESSGKINKFVGDASLSIFPKTPGGNGHRLHTPAARALAASLAVESKSEGLSRSLGSQVSFRIGIDRGTVIYGRTGSERNYELGVIGDAVNTASRLEELNRAYGTGLLVTREVLDEAGLSPEQPGAEFSEFGAYGGKVRPLLVDIARPKGKSRPEQIYTLLIKQEEGVRLFGQRESIRESVLVAFDRLQRHYFSGLSVWSQDLDEAEALWRKLAHGFARLAFRLGFGPARPFAERLVTLEQYSLLETGGGLDAGAESILISRPGRDWLAHGAPELQK